MDNQQPTTLDSAFKQENGMVPYWDHPEFRVIENSPNNPPFIEGERAGREFFRHFRSFKDYSILQIVAKLEVARVDDILAVSKSYGFSPTTTRVTLEQLFEKGFVQKFRTMVGADKNEAINNIKEEKVIYTLSYPAWVMIRNHYPYFKTQNPVVFWNQDATRGYNDPQMTIKRYTQLTHLFRYIWETGRLRNWEWRKTMYVGDGKMPTEGPIAIADIDIADMNTVKERTMREVQMRYKLDLGIIEQDLSEEEKNAQKLQLVIGISQNQNKRIYIDFWDKVSKFNRTYKKYKYMPIDKKSDFQSQSNTMPFLLWFVSTKEMMNNIIQASETKENFFVALKIPFAFVVGEWINEEDGMSKAIVRYNPKNKKWERVVLDFFRPDPDRALFHKFVERIEKEITSEKDRLDHEKYVAARTETLQNMASNNELTKEEQQRLKVAFHNLDVWS